MIVPFPEKVFCKARSARKILNSTLFFYKNLFYKNVEA